MAFFQRVDVATKRLFGPSTSRGPWTSRPWSLRQYGTDDDDDGDSYKRHPRPRISKIQGPTDPHALLHQQGRIRRVEVDESSDPTGIRCPLSDRASAYHGKPRAALAGTHQAYDEGEEGDEDCHAPYLHG